MDIPPGEKHYAVRRTFRLPVDVGVLGIYPHAHYLGKTIHCFAVLPDGRTEWLVRIDDWDFNWQQEYFLTGPVRFEQGDELELTCTWDNSAGLAEVNWGEGTSGVVPGSLQYSKSKSGTGSNQAAIPPRVRRAKKSGLRPLPRHRLGPGCHAHCQGRNHHP